MQIFEREQIVGLSLKDAWAFFSDPNNLPKITPEHLNFKIMNEPGNKIYAGKIIVYKVEPFFGIPVTWVTEIKVVEENKFFIDEQRVGPYGFWNHQHFFSETDQGTLIKDLVHYRMPFYPLGELFQFIVEDKLKEIFDYRQSVIAKL